MDSSFMDDLETLVQIFDPPKTKGPPYFLATQDGKNLLVYKVIGQNDQLVVVDIHHNITPLETPIGVNTFYKKVTLTKAEFDEHRISYGFNLNKGSMIKKEVLGKPSHGRFVTSKTSKISIELHDFLWKGVCNSSTLCMRKCIDGMGTIEGFDQDFHTIKSINYAYLG